MPKLMEKDRLTAFTDAVLAIIMTILILELKKPEETTFKAIWALKENYFCYTLSFFWLGIMWINLHYEWNEINKINQTVVWWSLILLFFSSWIPYSIDFVNDDPNSKVTQSFYGICVLLVTFANVFLSISVQNIKEHDENIVEKIKIRRKKLYPDIIIKIIGLILCLTVFPMAMAFSVFITMIWMLIPVNIKPKDKLEDSSENIV